MRWVSEYRTVLAADKAARSSPERGSGRPPQCLSPFPRTPGGYRASTSLVSISHLGNGLFQGNSTESLPGNSNPRSRATLPPAHDQVFVDSETRRSLGWVAHRHSRCQSACQSRCRETRLWGHWGEACAALRDAMSSAAGARSCPEEAWESGSRDAPFANEWVADVGPSRSPGCCRRSAVSRRSG